MSKKQASLPLHSQPVAFREFSVDNNDNKKCNNNDNDNNQTLTEFLLYCANTQ